MSGNQAISTNSGVFRHADLEITRHGSDWLFTVCAIMGAGSLIFLLQGLYTKPLNKRYIHYLIAGATFVSCISYFTMASNLGQVPIIAEWSRGWFNSNSDSNPNNFLPNGGTTTGTREIFYVRYIDWFVTLPLLLLALFLTARLAISAILCTILPLWITVICFLAGSLIQTRYKWGFFTFGTSALLFVLRQIIWDVRRHVLSTANFIGGGPVYKTYLVAASLLVVPWVLYPVAWGLCEGGNVIHPDSEAIFYGILDIISKVGFGAALLYGRNKIVPVTGTFRDHELGLGQPSMAVKGTRVGGSALGGGVVSGTGPVETGMGSTGQLMTETHAENSDRTTQMQVVGLGAVSSERDPALGTISLEGSRRDGTALDEPTELAAAPTTANGATIPQ